MKKFLIIIFMLILIAVTVLIILMKVNSQPITKEEALPAFETLFTKSVQGSKKLLVAQLLIHSDKLNIHQNYGYAKVGVAPDENAPFHIASIGKTFTATLIGILVDKERIQYTDFIANYLPANLLNGIFVYNGVDYSNAVTIEQLLRHTSGIADYFADPVSNGSTMDKLILEDKNHLWTPTELVAFTREHQSAVGEPGQTVHYSDTGYILLGLIIESVTGKPFHENLSTEIFEPLHMEDSYLLFYSKPLNGSQKKIAPILFNGVEVSSYNSLSVDWAGGGIISTTEDLLKFYKGLREGALISADRLAFMAKITGKFLTGIHLGAGLMSFRYEEFFFLLKGMPSTSGHIGILSTHMLYDPVHDVYIIANFGSTDFMSNSFQLIIQMLSIVERIR